jgi:signal transduction histidine kinase
MALEDMEEVVLLSRRNNLDINRTLAQALDEGSFFDRMTILSSKGEILTTQGKTDVGELNLVPEEIASVSQELENNDLQIIRIPPNPNEDPPYIHIIKAIPDEVGQPGQILWGYINLREDQFSETFKEALEPLKNNEGYGQIINKSGTVFYSSAENRPEDRFTGARFSTPTYYETPSNDGAYLLRYFYPLEGGEWAVVTSAPAVVVYQNAWQNSWPIFLFGLSIFGIFIIFTLAAFSPILEDIETLNSDMEKLARGSFDISHSEAKAKGEVAQLFEGFKQLAGSLTSRLQKQADLLSLNDQVSSKSNLEDSLHTIMDAALNCGADSVRIILDDTFGLNQPTLGQKTFSLGESEELFSHLDGEIKALVHAQGELILYDYQITRKLTLGDEQAYPSALIAIPMNWQGKALGIFWTAYREKSLPAEDIQFHRDLARKASMILAKSSVLGNALGLKNHLESILDILQDGILLINETDRVIYNNLSARSILGLSTEQMHEGQIQSLVNNSSLSDFITKADQNLEPRDFTMDDGTICRVSVSRVEDTINGRIRAVVLQDITRITTQDRLKSEFVTTASHELRSPLTLIHGYAKLLRLAGNLNDQQETYINNIIEGVEDMKNLVQNLLDVGRLESGHTLEISRISASELAKKVFESMQPFAKQRNIHLDLVLPDSPISLDADKIFLSQGLKNLIENAIKFTKMGGDVTLSVREMEENVVFSVQDTGIGIAPLDQRHLFEKFKHRGTPLGQESKGSGLGLAIVRSIAERHGGKIWFESQLAKGSTFYLEIPKKYGKNI